MRNRRWAKSADEAPVKAGTKTVSVRIQGLEELDGVIKRLGFKDRTHFFQLAVRAIIEVERKGERLEWPPRFASCEE
jgi:hypothetical protein